MFLHSKLTYLLWQSPFGCSTSNAEIEMSWKDKLHVAIDFKVEILRQRPSASVIANDIAFWNHSSEPCSNFCAFVPGDKNYSLNTQNTGLLDDVAISNIVDSLCFVGGLSSSQCCDSSDATFHTLKTEEVSKMSKARWKIFHCTFWIADSSIASPTVTVTPPNVSSRAFDSCRWSQDELAPLIEV